MIEITEWVEVPKKNVTLETNTTDETLSAESGTTDSKENSSSGSDADNSSTTNDESNVQDTITEKVLKKRTFRVPLKVNYTW